MIKFNYRRSHFHKIRNHLIYEKITIDFSCAPDTILPFMRALFCSSLIAVSLLVSVAQAATYIASGAFDSSKLSDSASWETGTLPNVTIDGNNVSFNGDGLLFTQSTINWTLNGTWTFQYLTFNNAAIEGGITPHTTLHLGANGRIVVDNVLNFSQAAKNPDSTFALHATLTGNSGTWYERNLISANSMWNIEAFQTGALSDHFYFDGYVLSDQILAPGYNVNDLEEGFAYIYYDKNDVYGKPASISVVYKGNIPEPTTAALGLLGLAGLLLQRRRI